MSEPMTGRVTLNVRETARALGVHENTVRNWADNGILTNVAALPLHSRRFDADQVEALAGERRRASFLRPRPEVLRCPVCGKATDPQPHETDREWAYICDTDTCPVSSLVIRWRTAQEELADTLTDRLA